MNDAQAAARPWPPAFSDDFIDGASTLFRETGHLMIVGPLGSNRGALASAVTGGPALTAWGREAHAYGGTIRRYATLNQLLPNLCAFPAQPTDEVAAQAQAILTSTFGRPKVSLREAELCDDDSIEVLVDLVEHRAIRLVSTVGPDAADAHPFARSAARIDLAPLDNTTIAQLLTDRFGATPHPTTVSMLATRSQGAYAVLKELADAGFRTGQIKLISGQLVTDAAVRVEHVDDAATAAAISWKPRFPADHPTRDLLDVAALTMALDHAEARSVFGDGPVSQALALGALRSDDTAIVFASSIEATSVRRHLSIERRTTLHELYFARLTQSSGRTETAPRFAAWLTSIGQDLPVDLATVATGRANREGRYELALLFVNAVAAPDRQSRLLIEQCHALSESGARSDVEALLRSIDPTMLQDDDLFAYLRWAGRFLPREEVQDLVAATREATDPTDDARHAAMTLCGLFGEAFQNGSEISRRSLATLAGSGRLTPVGQAMAQVAVALSLRQASRLDQAVELIAAAVATLLDSEDAATCNVEGALEAQVLCLLSTGDLGGARDALTTYSAPGLHFGNLGRLGTAMWGLHAFYTEDTGSALAHAQLCLARTPATDPHHLRGWMEALAALVLTQVGDIDQVHELLKASERHERNPRRQYDLQRRISQACVHDAIGEPDEALHLLQGVVDEARQYDMTLLEVDAAVLCVQIGGPVHLKQLLRAVEPIDESSGASRIWQRFAWAVRDNDMRALVSLAEELDEAGSALFAAEVAQFTLDIARRAADMTPAQRQRLELIADSMQHRSVTRSS